MTGPEHYREAEQLLAQADRNFLRGDSTVSALAAAQVHATLALAAATAVQPSGYSVARAEWKAWAAVAATPESEADRG